MDFTTEIWREVRRLLLAPALTAVLGGAFVGYLAAGTTEAPPKAEVAVPTFSFSPAATGSLFAKYPALPTEVQGMGGPVTVKVVLNPAGEDGEELWGSYEASSRTIEIEQDAPLEFQWNILGHELCHVTLFDSGLTNTLSDEGQEALCDAFGTARIQEMRGR